MLDRLREMVAEKQGVILFMVCLFALSLLHPTLMHLYLIIILPLVASFFFTPATAELIFLFHRGSLPKVKRIIKPTSTEYYYRFRLYSSASLFQILHYSTYPFLFFVSILFQTVRQPSFDYFLGMASVFNMLTFTPIFVLSAVIWVLDWSGLRFVNIKNQYIERLGMWFGAKFRGMTGIFAVASLLFRFVQTGNIYQTMIEVAQICVVFYIQIFVTTLLYFRFVLHKDLGRFEHILTHKYHMPAQRVEFSLQKTPFMMYEG
jgi:hypothetical protein